MRLRHSRRRRPRRRSRRPAQKPTPPATPPAAEQKPAPPPPAQPPKPFPEGAKVGYVDIQLIASNSAEGKAAAGKIQEWDKRKTTELQDKNKQAQAIQTKLAAEWKRPERSGALAE